MTQAVKENNDIPVPVAAALLAAVLVGFIAMQHGDAIKAMAAKLEAFAAAYPMTINISLIAICINLALIGYIADHFMKSIRKAKSLGDFAGDEVKPPKDLMPVLLSVMGWSAIIGILLFLSRSPLGVKCGLDTLPRELSEPFILNCAFGAGTLASVLVHFASRGQKGKRKKKSGLERIIPIPNSIFIGSVPSTDPTREEQPLILTEGALGGNVLITGSIGTGKTQGTILPYFSQILDNFEPTPAVLAIDPKGSFIKEAVAMAEKKGLAAKVRRLELNGSVSINPIYMLDVLKGGRCVQIAEMIQAAASNYSGGHKESPFWSQSGFNLIKYSLVYAAAMKPYYTLRDLHDTMRRCQDADFTDQLEKVLEKPLDREVRENISFALDYFSGEFSKYDEKVRSGIVATATAFLHQFQEYQATRLFCPTEEECTIRSIDEVVDQGLLLFFDVRNEGLARSMGTLIKLLYQQSVLNRIANDSRPADRVALLIIDEYQDVATTGSGKALGDERFLAKAREGRALTIVATQSVSSLETSLGSGAAVKELRQNFRTMICLQSTDTTTINIFEKLVGDEERERISRGYSEQTRDGSEVLSKKPSNRTESVTKSVQKEAVVTGIDFSSLGKFEAIALIYDGHTTRFIKKLLLKPYFLAEKRLAHSELTVMLRKGLQAMSLVLAAVLATPAKSFPNICDVVAAPEFNACLEYHVGQCVCPLPKPHPCASFTYYVPRTFVEVTGQSVETAFRGLPGVLAQLPTTAGSVAPFGTEGDDFAAFQARTLAVPFSDAILQGLPCRGGIGESACFGAMSEHLGPLWTSGIADRLQPNHLAWLASPKACLAAGLAKSATGGGSSLVSAGSPACSLPVARLPAFPPSMHEACNGWGLFYPRVGIYDGPSQTTAALMVASRMKSLSSEVFLSAPSSIDEKWQMISPSQSQCFREGQNVSFLETAGLVNDRGRLSGNLKNYLFVVWERRSCCHEYPDVAVATATLASLKAACQGLGGLPK